MVEDVVGIEAELRLEAFGNGESLRERHVVVEGMRTAHRIESRITDLATTGKRIWTGGRARESARIDAHVAWIQLAAVGERCNWREPVCTVSVSCDTGRNRGAAVSYVWTARASVANRAAFPDTRSKRKTCPISES